MAMNFFEHQDRARRRTGRLVTYFAMAVICIVLVLYVTGIILLNWAQQSNSNSSQDQYQNQAQVQPDIVYWNWEVLLGVIGLSGLIIGGVSGCGCGCASDAARGSARGGAVAVAADRAVGVAGGRDDRVEGETSVAPANLKDEDGRRGVRPHEHCDQRLRAAVR